MLRIKRITGHLLTYVFILTFVCIPTTSFSTAENELPQATATTQPSSDDTASPTPLSTPEILPTSTVSPDASELETPVPTEADIEESINQPLELTPMPESTPHPYLTFTQVEGGIAVSACATDTTEAIVPKAFAGQPVVRIASGAFSGCTLLQNVELPGGLLVIDAEAFVDCKSLSRVKISETVTTIDRQAFRGCPMLTIDAPESSFAREYAYAEQIPLFSDSGFASPHADITAEISAPTPTPEETSSVDTPLLLQSSSDEDPADELSLTISGVSSLSSNQSATLISSLTGGVGINAAVLWASSDPLIATISTKGVVKALPTTEIKTVTITATLLANRGVIATHTITILPLVTKVSVTAPAASIDRSSVITTLQLEASCEPAGSSQLVSWISNNSKVVSVDSNGLATAVGNGTATLTATARDGSQKKGALIVKVFSSVISLNIAGPTAVAYGKSIVLKPIFTPIDATNQKVVWSVSDPAIATISSTGVLKAQKLTAPKTVDVKVTSLEQSGVDGAVNSVFKIQVLPPVLKISITSLDETTTIDLTGSNPSLLLRANCLPAESSQEVVWKSSNTKVATVDSNGMVTALSKGATSITATARDGTSVNASFPITVVSLVQSVGLSGPTSVVEGKSITLKAQALPITSNQSMIWSTSDSSIATVSASGIVTAKKIAGLKNKQTVTITATSRENSELSANRELVVYPIVTSVDISNQGASVFNINSAITSTQLQATILPSDAKQELAWKSSNPSVAVVDNNGFVTGLKAGSVTISATATDGSGKADTVALKFQNDIASIEIMPISDVVGGESITPQVIIHPDKPASRNLKWTISDMSVVEAFSSTTGFLWTKTVDHPCTATLTAASAVDGTVSDSIQITVLPKPQSLSILAPSSAIDLSSDELALILEAKVLPDDALQKVSWSISDGTVAQLSYSGSTSATATVTGLNAGRVTITARASRYAACTYQLDVILPIQSVSLQEPVTPLLSGKTLKLAGTVAPENAFQGLTWTSSDNSVATVDANGVVSAKPVPAEKTVIITATSVHDVTKSASVSLTVIPVAQSVSFASTATTVDVSPTATSQALKVQVLPEDANQAVIWSSSNPSVISVDQNGNAKGLKLGRATITAVCAENHALKAALLVEAVYPIQTATIKAAGTTLISGKTMQLIAQAQPAQASQRFTWQSSDESAATINSNGLVTAQDVLSKMSVTITGTSVQDQSIKVSFVLDIFPAVHSASISSASSTIDLSLATKMLTLAASIYPADANQSMIWSSSNPTVISVDQNGVATGRKLGKATIKVVSVENPSIYAELPLEAVYQVQSVSIKPSANSLVGKRTLQLTAQAQPIQASQRFSWQSSDESAATVDASGKVTAQTVSEKKTVQITAISVQNADMIASVTLTILPEVQSMIITAPAGTIDIKQTEKTMALGAMITPEDANQAVTWSSNNPTVISVNQGGIVTALKLGKAIIKATSLENQSVTAEFLVEAVNTILSVSLNSTTTNLTSGQTLQLSAAAQPAEASQRFTWTSSDPSVATIDSNGLVTAQPVLAKETVTLTATSVQSASQVASVVLTISPLTKTLSISPMAGNLNLKDSTITAQLTMQFSPEDATPGIIWSIDHPEIASVSETGLVTGISPGTAKVTAVTQDGSHLSAVLKITVVSTDFYYAAVPEGLQVTQYIGHDAAISIPWSFGGVPVVSIGEGVFMGNDTITSVILPWDLMSIGKEAFKNCKNLSLVRLSSLVDFIGEGAFSGCTKLSEIKLD